MDGAVYDDLTKENNKETVQKLPQISFYAHPQSLFKTPFFYDVTSSYTNFWRERDVAAHRGDLLPRISYPVRLFNVLKLESDVALRETLYRPYDDPTNRFQGWKSRETLQAAAEISTEFYRVYDGTRFQRSRICIRWPNGCTPLNPMLVTLIFLQWIRVVSPPSMRWIRSPTPIRSPMESPNACWEGRRKKGLHPVPLSMGS